MDLRKLYHPGGLPRVWTESQGGDLDCPCGCRATKAHLSPEQLGIEGTPGLLEVARLKLTERQAKVKPPAPGKPWKGATVAATGTVELPDPCSNPKCEQEHATGWIGTDKDVRHHRVKHEVRVYRHPGGATMRVRVECKTPA